eukprot:gene17010-26099_t
MGETKYRVKIPGEVVPELFTVPARYKIDEKQIGLGNGTFGCVCAAFDVEQDEEVAIKKCIDVFSDGRHTACLREVLLLDHFSNQVKHPNIVRLRDCFIPSGFDKHTFSTVYLVLDRYDMSLKSLLDNDEVLDNLSEVTRCSLVQQLLLGLEAVHRAGFVHRDIKPDNLLVKKLPDGTYHLAICDFGSGRVPTIKDPTTLIPLVTTLHYMPPEGLAQSLLVESTSTVIRQGTTEILENPHATEIWGVGCIMWLLITGEVMCFSPKNSARDLLVGLVGYLGPPPDYIIKLIPEREQHKIRDAENQDIPTYFAENRYTASERNPYGCYPDECDLITRMLTWDPIQRITLEGALKHTWFNQLPPPPQLPPITAVAYQTPSNVSESDARETLWKFFHVRSHVQAPKLPVA